MPGRRCPAAPRQEVRLASAPPSRASNPQCRGTRTPSRGREGDIGTSAVIHGASPLTAFLFDSERMQHLILEPSRAEAVNLQVMEVDAVHLLRPILDAARSAGRQVLDDIALVVLVVPEAGGGSDRRLEAKRER